MSMPLKWATDAALKILGEGHNEDRIIAAEKIIEEELHRQHATANHEKFCARSRVSADAVDMIAAWFRSQGHIVQQYPYREAPTAKEIQFYLDHGDMGLVCRTEIKKRDLLFAHEWPYPTFYICSVQSFTSAFPKPAFYMSVSSDEKWAAVVFTHDRRPWLQETARDSYYSGAASSYPVWVAPRENVIVFELKKKYERQIGLPGIP